MGIQTTILRPLDATGGGHYRAGAKVAGLTVLAAGAPVAAFRWINTALRAAVQKVSWAWYLTTAFGAAQIVDHGLYKVTGWSASDTGGSTPALTPKRAADNAMAALVAGTDYDLRVGALGAGTRTVFSDWMTARGQWAAAIGNGILPGYDTVLEQEHEGNLVLGPNEGIELQNLTLMGATGVIALYFEISISIVQPANVVV